MNKELKRSKCLEEMRYVVYHASPNLVSSGRYIKALRHSQGLVTTDAERVKYEYNINRCLQKHFTYLQESIINSYGKKTNKQLSTSASQKIIALAHSEYRASDGRFSMVDVDSLKKMRILEKSVILKDDLVLPCKVRSSNQKYKFNTQIIMTKDNVLGYASYSFEYDPSFVRVNRNAIIKKAGDGLVQNEIIENAKKKLVSR